MSLPGVECLMDVLNICSLNLRTESVVLSWVCFMILILCHTCSTKRVFSLHMVQTVMCCSLFWATFLIIMIIQTWNIHMGENVLILTFISWFIGRCLQKIIFSHDPPKDILLQLLMEAQLISIFEAIWKSVIQIHQQPDLTLSRNLD